MNIYRKIELGLLGFFFFSFMLQLKGFLPSLISSLTLTVLSFFWIVAFIRSKRIAVQGFYRNQLAEKLLLLLLFWSVTLTLSNTAYASMLVRLCLLILFPYYFIASIIRWVRSRKEWPNAVERILLSLIFAGLFLRFSSLPGGTLLTSLSMLLLYTLLFIYGIVSLVIFSRRNRPGKGVLFLFIYFALCCAVLAMLFDLMFWPGAVLLLIIAIVSLLVTGVTLAVIKYRNTITDEQEAFVLVHTTRRLIVYSLIVLFFLAISPPYLLKFLYGNRKALIDASIKCRLENEDQSADQSCIEEERLYELYRTGNYPEERE